MEAMGKRSISRASSWARAAPRHNQIAPLRHHGERPSVRNATGRSGRGRERDSPLSSTSGDLSVSIEIVTMMPASTRMMLARSV